MEIRKLLLIFLFILIPLVSSIETSPLNSEFKISHSVRLNDAPLTSAPSCNITLFYNGSILISYSPMTYNSTSQTVNYTIPALLNNVDGVYDYDVTCCASGLCSTEGNSYEITKSGFGFELQYAILYIFMLMLSCGVFVFFFYLFYKTESSDAYNSYDELVAINYNKYKKYGLGLLSFLTFIWVIYSAWIISFNFLQVDTMTKILFLIWSLPIRYGGIILGIILFLFIWKIWGDFQKAKYIERFGE